MSIEPIKPPQETDLVGHSPDYYWVTQALPILEKPYQDLSTFMTNLKTIGKNWDAYPCGKFLQTLDTYLTTYPFPAALKTHGSAMVQLLQLQIKTCVPNCSTYTPISKASLGPVFTATMNNPNIETVRKEMAAGGPLSSSALFAAINGFSAELLQSMTLLALSNLTTPDGKMTSAPFIEQNDITTFYSEEPSMSTWVSKQGDTIPISSLPSDLTYIYNQFFSTTYNPFSAAGGRSSLVQNLISDGLYSASNINASASMMEATATLETLAKDGQIKTITAAQWGSFTSLLKEYAATGAQGSRGVSSFLEGMVAERSTISPKMIAWYMQATQKGIEYFNRNGFLPIPDGNFYTWIQSSLSGSTPTPSEFFGNATTDPIFGDMSLFSLILFNAMTDYPSFAFPNNEIFSMLNNALDVNSADFPMPGASTLPSQSYITNILADNSALINLLTKIAENGG